MKNQKSVYLDLSKRIATREARLELLNILYHNNILETDFQNDFKINNPLMTYKETPKDFLKISELDQTIVHTLVKENPYRVKYISHLIKDYNIKKLAVSLNCENINLFEDANIELMLIAIEQNGNMLMYVPEELQTLDIVISAFASKTSISWLDLISNKITNEIIIQYFEHNQDEYNIIKRNNPNSIYFNDCSKSKNYTTVIAIYKDNNTNLIGAVLTDKSIIDICSLSQWEEGKIDSLRTNWTGDFKIFKKNKKVYSDVGETYLINQRNTNGVKSVIPKELKELLGIN